MDMSPFTGSGTPRDVELPPPPPWRRFPVEAAGVRFAFQADPGLIRAINAAVRLRRPLLLTGTPGSGKSTVAEAIAHELNLGEVLRWNVTSRSTVEEAVYRYDAIGRLQHNQLAGNEDDIARFTRLGPLGTALAASTPEKPRVLLVDELDKGELDLPGDLLNIFERGEYEIPELSRHTDKVVEIMGADNADADGGAAADDAFRIEDGWVRCCAFPVVVITSNGEREFPAPFNRRCVRYRLAPPERDQLIKIVTAHFDERTAEEQSDVIDEFSERLTGSAQPQATLAIDQLLNAIYLLSGREAGADTDELRQLLTTDLDRTI